MLRWNPASGSYAFQFSIAGHFDGQLLTALFAGSRDFAELSRLD
jgi:hypothetical protein